MHRNIGSTDRIVRIIVGIVLLSLVFIGPRTAWGYLGLIPLGTALVGYCPLYGVIAASRRPARGTTRRA